MSTLAARQSFSGEPRIPVTSNPVVQCENVFADFTSWDQNEYVSLVNNAIRAFARPFSLRFEDSNGQLTSRGITFGLGQEISAGRDLSSIEVLVHDISAEYSGLFQGLDLSIPRLQAQKRAISLFEQLSAERRKQERRLEGDALKRFQASYADALEFSSSLTTYPLPNVVATADDGEIVFEWYGENHHLVVSIDGDGEYGYSYEVAGDIVAGLHEGLCNQDLPEDMRKYLDALAAS